MKSTNELFVGITSWNSELLLPLCLSSLRAYTAGISMRIVVLDNESDDESARIAEAHGAEVIRMRCAQGDALDRLAWLAREPFVLLMHADVVFLAPNWLQMMSGRMIGEIGLTSPEDIGCGPHTRLWGAGMPESSFMLFRRETLAALRYRQWPRRFRVPFPRTVHDFFGHHVTYNIPARLEVAGWRMDLIPVHVSPITPEPWFVPKVPTRDWSDSFGRLKYGLGNFYSVDGVITHYHNWYDRRPKDSIADDGRSTEADGDGFPVAFIARSTMRFISDYHRGTIEIPSVVGSDSAQRTHE